MGAQRDIFSGSSVIVKTQIPDLFPTQDFALLKIKKDLQNHTLSLLSMCPGGGKTITSLIEIQKFAKNGKKVLILAHGTNVLKSQWADVMTKYCIRFGTTLKSKESIILTIPQSISQRLPEILKFDLLVVDEAHEFYFASSVQRIISRLKLGARQLLLTGTPSEFVKRGYAPIIISAVDVFKEGRLSDTYFGMIRGAQKILRKDYNAAHEVKGTFEEKEKDIRKTLMSAVRTLTKKISKDEKISPREMFSHLEKTMIAARNINQATKIQDVLNRIGVHSIVSTSENDPNGVKIEEFKSVPDYKILIVVRRGILGFDMTDLACVIDFTGSRNINRIYQLYARVLRKHPKNKKKYFYRVCSSESPEIDILHMKAALCLANEDFISKFNGENLNGMLIPVKKSSSSEDDRARSGKSLADDFSLETLTDEDSVDQIRQAIFVNRDKLDSKNYAFIKFGDAVRLLDGKRFHDTDGNKQKLLEMAAAGLRKPTISSKDPEITRLARLLQSYYLKGSTSYDEEFCKKLMGVRKDWLEKDDIASSYKQKLILLAKSGVPRPSKYNTSREETLLSRALSRYTITSSGTYDKSFDEEIRSLRPDWFTREKHIKDKDFIYTLAITGEKRPSTRSKDAEERRLGIFLTSVLNKVHSFYDQEFANKLNTARPDWFANRFPDPITN